jgi:hypothetical protein
MRSSKNNPSIYTPENQDFYALFEALELADNCIDTEVENYHFIYRAAKWALENAPKSVIDGFNPNNDAELYEVTAKVRLTLTPDKVSQINRGHMVDVYIRDHIDGYKVNHGSDFFTITKV